MDDLPWKHDQWWELRLLQPKVPPHFTPNLFYLNLWIWFIYQHHVTMNFNLHYLKFIFLTTDIWVTNQFNQKGVYTSKRSINKKKGGKKTKKWSPNKLFVSFSFSYGPPFPFLHLLLLICIFFYNFQNHNLNKKELNIKIIIKVQ